MKTMRISKQDMERRIARLRALKSLPIHDGAHFGNTEARVTYEEILAQLKLSSNAALPRGERAAR